MTTTERPAESSTRAKPVSDVYTMERNGRTYQCQKMEYMGDVHEVCWDDRTTAEVFEEIFEGNSLKPGEQGHSELVEYLDQFLVTENDSKTG